VRFSSSRHVGAIMKVFLALGRCASSAIPQVALSLVVQQLTVLASFGMVAVEKELKYVLGPSALTAIVLGSSL
jgi:hypothetical protein